MTWALVLYFSVGWSGLPDRYTVFPDKESCYEALHEIQKRPEKFYMAFCEPAKERGE